MTHLSNLTTQSQAQSSEGPGHRAADALVESANRVTHSAADAVVDHVVRPVANAARRLEDRAQDTNRFLHNTLQDIEDEVHRKPIRALGYAVGFGFLLGLWFRRK
jgi:ElaB/YqjD/DUF883 family membrane-anchored ribosome-binding protein